MRASDSERERVVDLLKAAFIEGRLTKDELGERVAAALTARTRAELAMVTADIPADAPADIPAADIPAAAAAVAPSAPAPRTARRRPGTPAKACACMLASAAIMLADAALTGHNASPTANGIYFLCIMTFVVAFIAWLASISMARGPQATPSQQRQVPGGGGPEGPPPAAPPAPGAAIGQARPSGEQRPDAGHDRPDGSQAGRARAARKPVPRAVVTGTA